MPTRYILRVQVDPTDETDAVAERLLALVKESRAEEISVFFSHMEFFDGHDTLADISAWLDSSRPWRTALRAAGFAVSLNPPHVIGHADGAGSANRASTGSRWSTSAAAPPTSRCARWIRVGGRTTPRRCTGTRPRTST